MEIDERDRDKTSLNSHHGLFRFKRMRLGLKNALTTFQQAADVILARVKWQFALVYLNDIIIYQSSQEEHFIHLLTGL